MLRRVLLIAGGAVLAITAIAGVLAQSRMPIFGDEFVRIPVVQSDVISRVTINGVVSSSDRTTVYPQMPLRVRHVRVRVGERVNAGALLAELDPSTVDAELLKRRIAVARAEAALAKTADADGASSQTSTGRDMTLDRHVRILELREARLERDRLERIRRDCRLTAPRAGEIVSVAARAGEVTLPAGHGPPAFVIATSDRLEIELEADEFEAAGIHAGQRAVVFIDAWSLGRALIGTVAAEPQLKKPPSPLSGPAVFGVTVSVPEKPEGLRLGSSARVEIETGVKRQSPVVPVNAVIALDRGEFVIEVDARGAHKLTPIRAGLSDNHVVALESGPSLGHHVLIGDSERLRQWARDRGLVPSAR